jgi:hypothetical protein
MMMGVAYTEDQMNSLVDLISQESEKELAYLRAELAEKDEVLKNLAAESRGFINCHEFALSTDGGNSNMAVMNIRIQAAIDVLAKYKKDAT